MNLICSSDMNYDGIINVVDVVAVVNVIINGVARVDDASEATITIAVTYCLLKVMVLFKAHS